MIGLTVGDLLQMRYNKTDLVGKKKRQSATRIILHLIFVIIIYDSLTTYFFALNKYFCKKLKFGNFCNHLIQNLPRFSKNADGAFSAHTTFTFSSKQTLIRSATRNHYCNDSIMVTFSTHSAQSVWCVLIRAFLSRSRFFKNGR